MKSLKELRQNAMMKQATLAVLLGVSRPTVCSWEIGTRAPDRKTAERIAQIFNVPFAEIDCLFIKGEKDQWHH